MHAVVGAAISAAAQFLEQPLRRAALALGQRGLRLQNLRQRLDPNAQLRRRLNVPRVLELRLWPRMTLRTVARETESVRTISLIDRFCSK